MLEEITATCRALACEANLIILELLSREGELSAGDIAERAGRLRSVTSTHLGKLATQGLVERRRSGGRVHYQLCSGPVEGTRFAPTALLGRAFGRARWAVKGWDEGQLLHISGGGAADEGSVRRVLLDVVYDAATAFTNVRRLQIVCLLAVRGAITESAVRGELSMSRAACWRHLDKLVSRGYARSVGQGGWEVRATGRTPFHRGLRGSVLAALGGSSRCSRTPRR